MEEFATEHGIQYGTLREIMTEYVFSGNISDEAIRQRFRDYHFGLLKMTKLTEETRAFTVETYKKYKAEGD
jgi:type I restriction enzyme R subunit